MSVTYLECMQLPVDNTYNTSMEMGIFCLHQEMTRRPLDPDHSAQDQWFPTFFILSPGSVLYIHLCSNMVDNT